MSNLLIGCALFHSSYVLLIWRHIQFSFFSWDLYKSCQYCLKPPPKKTHSWIKYSLINEAIDNDWQTPLAKLIKYCCNQIDKKMLFLQWQLQIYKQKSRLKVAFGWCKHFSRLSSQEHEIQYRNWTIIVTPTC